jgi:hypothetical protein
VYLKILDRLNERAVTMAKDEIDIILDDSIGQFFPYYAKQNKPELFDSLMRKQNHEMSTRTSAIPIFGYTQEARDTEIEYKGMHSMLQTIVWNHPHIYAIKPTASSIKLGKYMVLVDREVEDFLDEVFNIVPELKEYPENFKKPQRSGNSFRKNQINNISNYLKSLKEKFEMDIQMGGDDNSDYTQSPPMRTRHPTISYAQATKHLTFKGKSVMKDPKDMLNTANTMTTIMSTLTQVSLNEAINNL